MASITQFFRNVSSEMRKVSWPKKKELTNYTITVIITVAILALFFTGTDLVFSKLIKFLLNV
ncbi:MAG TPA: preprotein translocase subunit SecE [Bacillaceae bacterium]|nr:preprotein translocase subunit SecE [Paenibacillus bovis]HLU22578.1 preprotein translocase subunit SecE [Bacillaceae bacterium]